MSYLVRAYYSISPTRYYKDDSCWSADLKSNTTEDVISIGSFMEVLVLNHYVLVRKLFSESTQERIAGLGEAKTTSTPTSPTTQAQVTYVSESVSYLKFEAKTFKVNEELGKVSWWEIVRRRPAVATNDHMILSYDVLIIQNIRVNSFTMKMEILLESTSNKLMVVTHWFTLIVLSALRRSDNENMLSTLNASAGNPVKKILLKLNLSDHRLSKMVVEYMFQDFRYSDTAHLSRRVKVLKLKNFKKDATLKLFKNGMSMSVQKSQVHKLAMLQDGIEIVLG
ncbi:hypothetical protein Tco_0303054 [Tanacetum coccineum]